MTFPSEYDLNTQPAAEIRRNFLVTGPATIPTA
jgi:hypothetical protein